MALFGEPTFPAIDVPGEGDLYARLNTTEGVMVVKLEEQRAPKTVANFVGLATGKMEWKDPKTGAAQKGVPLYDGVRFHRVIPEFMIQCGDPFSRYTDESSAAQWGRGGPGYRFADEFHPELRHRGPGVLSMANSGPGTNGSQWFITERDTAHLDNRHSVFGKVIAGLDIVNKIARVNRGRADRPVTDVVLTKVDIFRSASVPTA
jgi:peptidyl-prolyl cis-trans isomerase A (cyclophilin A)